MRALLLVSGALLGILVAERATAQDAPAEPGAQPPAEGTPPAPPVEPAPQPAPPPPKESAPPVVLEETPEEPPPPASAKPPPKKASAPTPVTLEETPEGPPAAATKPQAARRRPKAQASPPTEPPESPKAPTAEQAPEPSPVEAPRESDEAESKSKDDEGDGLLGPFRIGVLVGSGLPSIVSFGGMIKLTRYLGAGLNVGLIPAIKLSLYGDAELSYQEYDIYGRLFPFGGMVFLGAGVGYATMNGSFKSSYDVSAFQAVAPGLQSPLSVASKGSVKTLVLTPTLGLLHTFGSGFTLGIDVGAQIPIAPSTTRYKTTVPSSVPPEVVDKYVKPNDKKVQDTLDTVGRTILPTLNLRVGWLL